MTPPMLGVDLRKSRLPRRSVPLGQSGLALTTKMVDREDFYHGGALARLLANGDSITLARCNTGYLVNGTVFALVRYSKKTTTPWRFTLNRRDFDYLDNPPPGVNRSVLALVCGGDGVCALDWREARSLLGDPTTWICATRMFNKQYSVAGPAGRRQKKVSYKDWISLVVVDGEQV